MLIKDGWICAGVAYESRLRRTALLGAASALDMLRTARSRAGVVTFSPEIDKQLFSGSGGVPVGQMTEFCGAPGMGKTQLCMQLACNVSIPKAMGGVAGSCVYIDTEGSFMVDRVHQIASALVQHLRRHSSSAGSKRASSASSSASSISTAAGSVAAIAVLLLPSCAAAAADASMVRSAAATGSLLVPPDMCSS